MTRFRWRVLLVAVALAVGVWLLVAAPGPW